MKYVINTTVTSARGTQTYTVEADSAEEAREKYEKGEANFEFEDLEVYDSEIDSVEIDD